MTLRTLSLTAAFCFGAIFMAEAQTGSSSPTMNPGGDSGSNPANSLGVLQKDRPKGARTEITARDEATFDNVASVAVFKGKVVVKDPQFTLYCETLTVNLNPERKGIDRAIAEGNVVIIQENVDDQGNPKKSTGRSGKATFEPATGNITLEISPQIQQDINNHIATEPGTVMILNREGRLETIGGSRTVIIDAASGGAQ